MVVHLILITVVHYMYCHSRMTWEYVLEYRVIALQPVLPVPLMQQGFVLAPDNVHKQATSQIEYSPRRFIYLLMDYVAHKRCAHLIVCLLVHLKHALMRSSSRML